MGSDKMKKFSYIDERGNKRHVNKNLKKTSREDLQWQEVGKYMNLGYYLIVPILFSLVGGVFFDKIFQSRPIFTLSGIIIGTILTFYNLFSLVKSEDASHQHKGRTDI